MIKIQRYHIIFSFLFIFLGLNAQEEGHIPTAIFKAIFWDKFTSKNLSYAPWGNHNDKNATMVSLQVGFSTVSRPFVYYGSSPVKFFEKIYQPETSSDYTISDQTKKELGSQRLFLEMTLDMTLGQIIFSQFLCILSMIMENT